jgi:hypothetical protein
MKYILFFFYTHPVGFTEKITPNPPVTLIVLVPSEYHPLGTGLVGGIPAVKYNVSPVLGPGPPATVP